MSKIKNTKCRGDTCVARVGLAFFRIREPQVPPI